MRKLLACLVFFTLWLAPAAAQFNGCPPGFCSPPAGSAPTTCVNSGHATAFLARAGSLDATHTTAYTNLLNGLDTDSLSCKLDILYAFATQNSTVATYNLIQNAYNGVIHGAPTFTADRGFSGVNGSTTIWMDTGFNPFNTWTAGTSVFTQNLAHMSIWNLTNAQNTFMQFGGGDSAGNNSYIFPQYTDGNAYMRLNGGGAGNAISVPGPISGFYTTVRDGVLVHRYKAGVSLGDFVSTAIPPMTATMGAIGGNSDTGPTGSSNLTAIATVGALLSPTEAANLYARVCTYMGEIGAPGGCPPTCTEATNFLARTTGLDTLHTNAYKALICGLVTDGVWPKLDMLFTFATQDATTAGLNLVKTQLYCTPVGSPTFTADRGFTGTEGSTTVRVDCGGGIGAFPVPAYTTNNAHFSAWSNSSGTTAGVLGGEYGGGAGSVYIQSRSASNIANFTINNTPVVSTVGSITDGTGFYVANIAGGTAQTGWKNGVLVAGPDTVTASYPWSGPMFFLAANGWPGSVVSGTGSQVSGGSFGGALTAGDQVNLYTRMRAFMTTVGVP